jgi:hypothetical protein
MVELKWFPVAWNVQDTISYSNWVVVNNTFVGASKSATLGFYKRNYLLTNATLRAVRVVNNVVYDSFSPSVAVPHGRSRDGLSTWSGPAGEVVFDFNVISRGKRGRSGEFEMAAFGTRWKSLDEFSRKTIFKNNRAGTPLFAGADQHDYRLAGRDHVARDTGQDLSFLNLPGLDTDLWGNRRGLGGAWDRGAIEYAP